jgi:ABC transporter substrate binding protein/Phage integrase family
MDRRRFLVTSLAGALVVPLTAGAQLSKPIVRIGFLSSSSAERERPRLTAFQQTLRELGYLEGQNIVIEPRYAGGNFQQLPSLAAELAHVKLDILVAAGAPASLAARKTTSVIPIVMVGVADPVGVGLVDSLARPGGNITGLSDFNAGVVAKRLELLREVVPSASRVVVLGNPTNPSNPLQVKLTEAAAATPFTDEAEVLLREQRARIVAQLGRLTDCCFPILQGRASLLGVRRGAFVRAWASATKAAGVPGLLFHDLRRTAGRNLVRAGVSQKVAQEISGHKSATVFARYNITSADDRRNAMAKVAAFQSGGSR